MASKQNNSTIGHLEFTGAILKPFKLAWRFTLVYLSFGLTSMLITILVFKFWWDAPVETLQQIYENSLESARLGGSTVASHAAALSSEFSYWIFFKATLIHSLMDQLDNGPPLDRFGLAIAKATLIPLDSEVRVAMIAAKIYGIRVALFIMCIPFFIVAYAVGFCDGLVERYIRTVCGGRESAGLYHRAKYAQLGTVAICLTLFLLTPRFIDPRWLAPPIALLIGFFSRLQWKWYKKHL